jgi:hypothetical protein
VTNKQRSYYESEAVLGADSTVYYRWIRDPDGRGRIQIARDNVLIHSASLSAPQKIFRYITVNPSLSLRSVWVPEAFTAYLDSTTNTLLRQKQPGLAVRTTGSFTVNLRTQIYGMFPIRLGALAAVRHVASPSVGYSFTPDFSKPLFGHDWGYFESVPDTSGKLIQHDRFAGTPAGSTPSKEQQSLTFSLNNVFQAKLNRDGKEKKVDFLSWRLSTGYNFAAENFPWSHLRSSLRSNLVRKLNLDLSLTHDFYDFDPERGQRLKSLHRNAAGIPVPRLINARLSTGFRFSGRRLFTKGPTEETAADTTSLTERLDDPGIIDPSKAVTTPPQKGKLWSTTLSLSYALNRADPRQPVKTFWMNANTTLQITKKWRIQHTARFDLVKNELVSQHFSIYRDLHCWEMSITWTPTGFGQGFYLRLNVKSPTLRDLKIEQRGGIYTARPNF